MTINPIRWRIFEPSLTTKKLLNMKTFIFTLVGISIGLFIGYLASVKYKANISIYTPYNIYHVDGLRVYDEIGHYDITFKNMELLNDWIGNKTSDDAHFLQEELTRSTSLELNNR